MVCWNVNGVRAVHRKGLLSPVFDGSPDVVCLQETKASPDQYPEELRKPEGYMAYFNSPKERSGYSGVALYTKIVPEKVEYGLGEERFDVEGRTIIAHFKDLVLYDVYFPNGKASKERLIFKMDFYERFLKHVMGELRSGREVIICGDVNTAHKEIDLARPKENEKVSGFLKEEREWIDRLLASGFIDTFRYFDGSPGRYTWWDMKSKARERNVGWRIDYFFISKGLSPKLRSAFIMSDVQGSDHCPVGIELDL
ncbi:MAG: exodeoxyribonuclease III [Methanomassiliicoccales archaeon]|nr:MAG: exodeoxyribonuclease III [Methanomassiliicoccales archaeon]